MPGPLKQNWADGDVMHAAGQSAGTNFDDLVAYVNQIAPSPGLTSTATAGGTTTMDITSTQIQVWTGTTTQIVKLPTTSVLAGMQYLFINNSTGIVTVQSSGGNTILLLLPKTSAVFTAVSATPTTAAGWYASYPPRGVIATAIQTAEVTAASTTLVQVTGCSVTWTADPNRKYRTTVNNIALYSTVAQDRIDCIINDGTNGVGVYGSMTVSVINAISTLSSVSIVESGLSGSVSRMLGFARGVGSGTCHCYWDGSAYYATIVVEDIGPA
jgi:hypothetical protein